MPDSMYATSKPLIVQGDRTILIDVHDPLFVSAQAIVSRFAELIKSPEHMHTYSLTSISLWNAASAGIGAAWVIEQLQELSRFPLPEHVSFFIHDTLARYGSITMHEISSLQTHLFVAFPDRKTLLEVKGRKEIGALFIPAPEEFSPDDVAGYSPNHLEDEEQSNFLCIHRYSRGDFKLQMIKAGFPVDDRIPLKPGKPYRFSLLETSRSGYPFVIREYQQSAVTAFLGDRSTGYGTLVLPCGSGKTIIGIGIMRRLQTHTLIVTTNIAAVHQWMHELRDKTDIPEEDIGEYSGDRKEIRPITICTYQILTWRRDRESDFPHFTLFTENDWGLIIYDEVHVLPAPVFKVTSEIQAVSRLGLTATLVREDNREEDVFSLVGPKRYDVPWRELEQHGWIAEAHCYEIRIPLAHDLELDYAISDRRRKFRIAAENPEKVKVVRQLIANHPDDYILIIGQYIDQLQQLADDLGMPIITGATPNRKREELYDAFRSGSINILIVSKVANFAIDLPDASVAIQISGTFGSRQEEAQRLGRILRPKKHGSHFYSLISRFTTEEDFAANRQKFLVEQGYKYHIESWD